MAASRTSRRVLLVGLVAAVLALLFGSAGSAGAGVAPYPPSPASYNPGSIVVDGDTVTACGPAGATDPGAAYSIEVDGVVIATGTTDADGSYCRSATVPAGLAPGSHTATFTSQKNAVSFTLSASFDRAAKTALPRTGTDSMATVQLAVVLLAAGAGLLTVVGVRRRTVKA